MGPVDRPALTGEEKPRPLRPGPSFLPHLGGTTAVQARGSAVGRRRPTGRVWSLV